MRRKEMTLIDEFVQDMQEASRYTSKLH